MKSIDARSLLDGVLRLIEDDVKNIEGSSRWTTEPGAFSADLTRYTTALLAISKDSDQAKDAARDVYRKMTDEQLVELMEKAKATLKPKDGTPE